MDALDEVLGKIRLDCALFFRAEFSAPWCIRQVPSLEIAPFLTHAQGSVKVFHLLLEGTARIRLTGGETKILAPGDVVLLPHGDEHLIGNGLPERPVDSLRAFGTLVGPDLKAVRYGGGGEITRFVCGFVACSPHQADLVLHGLPSLVVANLAESPESGWLSSAILGLAGDETGGRPSDIVLAKLAEGLFLEVLRRFASKEAPTANGWLAGTQDKFVGRALSIIHKEPTIQWTLSTLAREVGISRSRLAERFQRFLGCSPIAYLTQWRHRLAADMLAASDVTLAEVARNVGYSSEAGFSRAFYRHFGLSPGKFRRRRTGPKLSSDFRGLNTERTK